MNETHDNFSDHPKNYLRYRPGYPGEMYDHIYSFVTKFDCALDCATGNGQIAIVLAEKFSTVKAIDMSAEQLSQAQLHPHIEYLKSVVEKTDFNSETFDLITAGQSVHWFDHTAFFIEANRLLKSNGVLALIGYDLISINTELNALIEQLYHKTLFDYWDDNRKLIDNHYKNLPFSLNILSEKIFYSKHQWTIEHLLGYLETWSAVKHYRDRHGESIISHYRELFKYAWGNEEHLEVTFPVFVKIGRK